MKKSANALKYIKYQRAADNFCKGTLCAIRMEISKLFLERSQENLLEFRVGRVHCGHEVSRE